MSVVNDHEADQLDAGGDLEFQIQVCAGHPQWMILSSHLARIECI